MIVTGGWCTFGNARTKGSDLADMLSAELRGPFDVPPQSSGQRIMRPT